MRKRPTATRIPFIAGLAIAAAALAAVTGLTTISSSTAAPMRAGAAVTPRCATSGMEVWLGLGEGGGAAGSTYYPMEFTNVSGHTCHLFGFPGVSAYAGHQVGLPARWDHSIAARVVTLAPGSTAHTVLQIVDVSNYPAAKCVPVTVGALRVYPPNQLSAASIPFRFRACSIKALIFLSVQPIQPRVGVPGHPTL
jgi:hypothetical protein